MARFAVVDLSNLIHRSRHSSNADAETKAGLALHIIFRSLRKMHRELKIDHIVIAVDHGSWRTTVYPDYKARRRLLKQAATPDEVHENRVFTDAHNALIAYLRDHTRCTVLDAPFIEGDDFVAQWIVRHPSDDHIIISGDSDFVQLVDSNVKIYEAINQRLIAHDCCLNEHGKRIAFSVNPKDGKIKFGQPDANFRPEVDWMKKALFLKLLRGDTGDSIFSAFPGVRYEGKKCSIRAAWDDRRERGYDWNNLMFQTWEKVTGQHPDGSALKENVRVIDEYRINESLIDLRKQPQPVIEVMNATIDGQITKPLVAGVGPQFLKFCIKHDLPALSNEAGDHVVYLNAAYPHRS